MDIDTINFDEADDVSFWTRDIGMSRRRVTSRKEELKKAEPVAQPIPAVTNEGKEVELNILKKQFEKQSAFLKDFVPSLMKVEAIFKDALLSMEADSFDDVYHIREMQTEFKKLNVLLTKHLPKEEPIVKQEDNRNCTTTIW